MPSVCVFKTHRLCLNSHVKTPHRGRRKSTARQAKQQPIACSACKPVTTLPNGLTVCYASKYDVSFLYREIFEEQLYLQHGISLKQGDTVVDVGGNIGFFALFAAQQVGPSGQVVSVEPIPNLHEKLSYNIKSHQKWCAAQGQPPASPIIQNACSNCHKAESMDVGYACGLFFTSAVFSLHQRSFCYISSQETNTAC